MRGSGKTAYVFGEIYEVSWKPIGMRGSEKTAYVFGEIYEVSHFLRN